MNLKGVIDQMARINDNIQPVDLWNWITLQLTIAEKSDSLMN